MDARKLALLVGALVIAAVSAFMVRSLIGRGNAPAAVAAVMPAQPDGPQVLVATRKLPVGTILTQDAFRYQPWPKELMDNAYFVKGAQEPPVLGTVVRYAITAGQPITQGALVKPGDRGFLAAALGPGMRAVTVSVSAQSGVAGFVFPGDHIDLVLTQTVEGGGSGPALKTSETIIRNLRVLATDQRTDSTPSPEGKTEVKTFSNVTLEVTPRLAEKIAVAQTIGQLSLSLRSIADNNAELDRAIAAGEVTVSDSKDPKAEKQMLLAVTSRPVDTDTTYVTGADVSRFQRRTVPAAGASFGPASPMSGPGNNAAPATGGVQYASEKPKGPVVKVARGSAVSEVEFPVGGK